MKKFNLYDLPQEILRYIFDFDDLKYKGFKQILTQYIKGGFNTKNYNIDNYIKNERFYASSWASWRNSRNSKVTKWLRNIEKFQNTHPELATYLPQKIMNKKLKKALKHRDIKSKRKIFLKKETQRHFDLINKEIAELEVQMKSQFYHQQNLKLPINSLRNGHDTINNTWEEDETINCDICNGKIIYMCGCYKYPECDLLGRNKCNLELIRKSLKTSIRIQFDDGQQRFYTQEYLNKRIKIAEEKFGVTQLSFYIENEEEEVEMVEIIIDGIEYYFDEKGKAYDIKNLILLKSSMEPIGLYDKTLKRIYKLEFES